MRNEPNDKKSCFTSEKSGDRVEKDAQPVGEAPPLAAKGVWRQAIKKESVGRGSRPENQRCQNRARPQENAAAGGSDGKKTTDRASPIRR